MTVFFKSLTINKSHFSVALSLSAKNLPTTSKMSVNVWFEMSNILFAYVVCSSSGLALRFIEQS